MKKLYKQDKPRFIIGLILIILIYSSYYIFFAENPDAGAIPRKLRHVIKLGTTIVVYVIGSIHLGKLKDQWMAALWHIIHISGLGAIFIIGGYDWLISESTLRLKLLAQSIQEMLISPMLYLAMGLLNRSLNKGKA
ncbi:hypothetical protein FUA26_06320 [Seonamhaeicola algicola]|uniref:Uncharacterized protein n=1 Tax=Seonamhaeicola algicola TaxID=1719036 RepID=A0A5C7AVR4_9FLAO|nr:hypothetical protein [Seonamhaeicola algicola]TXE11679.1 hypothetical protein FUA26_06320 [Seonamhaeicola algicola]